MPDPPGHNVRTPAPAEKPEETAGKAPVSSGTGARARAIGAQAAALVCGALAIVSVFQLAKSAPYLGGAGLFAGVVTGTIAALLARADVSLRIAIRLVCMAAVGVVAALIIYIVAINVYSPGAVSALPDIQPVGDSAHDVPASGIASFAVTVPPRYHKLMISFTVTNSDVSKSDNCINGSQEDVTATSGAWLAMQDIATGETGTLEIPPGVSGFTLAVQFQPPLNDFTVCLEDIQVANAQFSN